MIFARRGRGRHQRRPATITAGGATATYTITVSNNGPSDAQNVTLTDILPGLTFESAMQTSGPGFTETDATLPGSVGGVLTFNIGTLLAGDSGVFEIVVSAPANAVNGTNETNSAFVTTDTPETTTANNFSFTTAMIVTEADLAVTKEGPATPVVAGQNITYTITIDNNGPSDAQTVTLTDNIRPARPSCRPARGPRRGWCLHR